MSFKSPIPDFESYRNQLENNIFALTSNLNGLLSSTQYRLWYYINENAKYDFYYLYTLDNRDYSTLGYPVAYRNIRSSMESFYDLICFNKYPDEYYSVCKFQVEVSIREDLNIELNNNDYNNLNHILSLISKNKISRNRNFYYINLENKAKLAAKCTTNEKIITEIGTTYEPIRKESNKYAHSPLLISIDSEVCANKLLNAECHLLCYSYIELYNYLSSNYHITNLVLLAYNNLISVYKKNQLI